MVNESWLTTREASERAGVSDAYLRRLCGSGKLKARNLGNVWLIDPESFRQWQETRQEVSGAESSQ